MFFVFALYIYISRTVQMLRFQINLMVRGSFAPPQSQKGVAPVKSPTPHPVDATV